MRRRFGYRFSQRATMRHSKTEKAKTHERIVAIAAKKFREEGLAGIGIADLMKEAGLTVGGFYKHFHSRDALVVEAVGRALELWKRQVDAAASGGPPVTYESLVDEYLSEAHRNHPGTGCPVSALAGDLARSDKRTRAGYLDFVPSFAVFSQKPCHHCRLPSSFSGD